MRSLFTFFSLTFVVSWAFFFMASRVPGGIASVLAELIVMLGVFAPALLAVTLTARDEGWTGVLALLRRMIRFPAGAQWYVFAIGFVASIKLCAGFVDRLATGQWPAFGPSPWYAMAAAILFSTPVQAGEEVGWRGYALPRLTREMGLAPASLVLGAIWACWHLPFFFIPGSDNFGRSFPLYLLAVMALSVAMAWLYWRTKGSLFIVMLMHAAINNTAPIVSSPASSGTHPFALSASLLPWLTPALLWICALCFLYQMRRATPQPGYETI